MDRRLIFLGSAFLFLAFHLQAKNFESYNHLQWNRANRETSERDERGWYEWWYYKVNIPETDEAFYFIYGVVNPWDANQQEKTSRAYLSFGSFSDLVRIENSFAIKDFSADYDSPYVRVGSNEAGGSFLRGQVLDSDKNIKVSWDLKMKSNWSFNAMGWGLYLPWISNIHWYPAQASATMSGEINYGGRKIILNEAPAYQDRNWGRTFPKWWTWLVSNSFDNSPGTSLAVGGGLPRVLQEFSILSGLVIGFNYQGEVYSFRTSDGDRVNFDIRFGKWLVDATNRRHQRIRISAYAPAEKFMILPFDSPDGKVFYDYEALKGEMKVELFERKNFFSAWNSVATLESREAGIEFGSFDHQEFKKYFNTSRTFSLRSEEPESQADQSVGFDTSR